MNKLKLIGLAIAALFTSSAMAASYVPQQTLSVEQDTIVYASYFAEMKNGDVNNWAVDQSIGSKTDKTFKAVDEFVADAVSGAKTLTLKGHTIDPYNFASTGRTLHMRIKGSSAVTVYGVTSSANRGFSVYATPIENIIDENTTPVLKVQDIFAKGSFKLEVTDLDPAKEYVISVRTWMGASSTSDSECYLYAVRFVAGALPTNLATLKSIEVDGNALEGFAPEAETYNIELPFGTINVPTITATATSKNANVVVNATTALPGATTIVVTAEDGTTTKTYTINFTVATTASSEKELFNVTIDGKLITLTDGQGSLTVYKNTDVTAMTVAFELSDKATASFTSGSTHDFTNPLVITVTAQDGTSANYTLTVTKAEKTILYLTRNATEGDLMYAAIAAKGYYMEVRANGDNTDFSNYDLVVLHESLDGKAAASGELAALKTANVPVLNTKSWFYQSGRWDLGTATNGNTQKFITIPTGEYGNIAQHPIFKGIDLTSNTVNLYNNEVAKNIQPVESFTAGMEGYTLATVEGGTAIHELPAATRVGAEGTAKYILISLLSSQFGDLTAEAQTILANACDYLMGTEAWIPQAPEVKSDKKDVLSFSLNGVEGTIDNENRTIAVNYYDFLGAVTSLTANIKVSDYATISENMAAAQDYTNPVVFTVTAQDGTTADYTVTVTVSAMPALAKTAMPYVSVMNEAWTTPEWMYLINTETDYNGTYSTTGGKSDAECTVNGGAYRLTKEGKIYMQLEACDSIKVITSATGSRNYQLEVVGGTQTASKSTKSNIKTTTTLVVGSDSPVLICLSTPEAGGGFTFSGVEVYWKEKVAPTAIALDQEAANMTVGQTLTLTVITTPEGASLEGLTWTSSDEKLATVKDGVVTAVAPTPDYEYVTIIATLGELTATCDVAIYAVLESIKFKTTEMDTEFEFEAGLEIPLNFDIQPANASTDGIIVTSSNTAVATITEQSFFGMTFFTMNVVGVGITTLKVTTADGKLSDELVITVTPPAVHATAITVDKEELTLNVGDTYQLVATMTPADAVDVIEWNSTKQGVATVENGLVTAVGVGEATIWITAGWDASATCKVTVNDKGTGLENIAELDTNAPIYNVLGQEVNAEYKGVVIQNGKKFLLQ